MTTKHYAFLLNSCRSLRSRLQLARRLDNDDVACFDAVEPSDNPRVIIIHDWASPGWENRGEFNCFLTWFEFAKKESREWKDFLENPHEKI